MSDKTTPTIPASMLVAALQWIDRNGSLVDFDCPDKLVPALFATMRGKRLIARSPKGRS